MEPRGEALAERFEAALDRIGECFLASSPLQNAAADIARRLSEMGIDYAIAGAPWRCTVSCAQPRMLTCS